MRGPGHGQKDGRQVGRQNGGRGRNQTTVCRHPGKRLNTHE